MNLPTPNYNDPDEAGPPIQREYFQPIDEDGDIFKQMFTYSVIPIIIHDMEMKIMDVNDRAIEAFGYSKRELLEKLVFDLHPEEELDHSHDVLEQMGTAQKLSVETMFKRKDGSLFFAEATPCKYIVGGKPLIHVYIQDITERKQAMRVMQDFNAELEVQVAQRNAALIEKNQALESFSYSVSHDLQSPLRTITAFAHLLKDGYEAGLAAEEGVELLDSILQNASKMNQLIADILQLSKLTQREMVVQEVNMTEVFRSVYQDLTQQTGGRQIVFELEELKPCQADQVMMVQLVTNLLSNAIKYTGPREVAKIQVKGTETKDGYVYSVQDNGVGFQMKQYDKLFKAFERLHKQRDFEGTGVGLSIVHKVITAHQGRIWAESEVGEGTTFQFTVQGQ
jgi:PAS domain S-box-containing protein